MSLTAPAPCTPPARTMMDVLDELLRIREAEVEAWFAAAFAQTPPPLYSSVDLRHSGFKIAPVDTNLFPGGFNHLSEPARKRAAEQVKAYFSAHLPEVKRLVLVPENHTRNVKYLENLGVLKGILQAAGFEVRLGWLPLWPTDEVPEEVTVCNAQVPVTVLQRQGGNLVLPDGFVPDALVLNHDLSAGLPDILLGVSQPLVPSAHMGWFRRRKSEHFEQYAAVASEFAAAFGLDAWQLNANFAQVGGVNFKEKAGLEALARAVQGVLDATKAKYDAHGIPCEPYVFIKADSGTYGMGIMTAFSAEDVLAVNKDIRKKMNVIKEGVINSEVIIQEGVPTLDKVDEKPAEPMIYLVNGVAVGGAYRVNENRDAYSNLNSLGMSFAHICDSNVRGAPEENPHCNFRVYACLARLATLAAAREMARVAL